MTAPGMKLRVLLFLLAPIFLGMLTQATLAQSVSAPVVPVEIQSDNGYARMIFKWQNISQKAKPPKHTANIENGVLVLRFDQDYQIDLNAFREQTESYIALVRQDDDGKTLRMALKFPFRALSNVDKLDVAIDLVPESYSDDPEPYKVPDPKIDMDKLVITGEHREVPTAEALKLMQVSAKPIPSEAPRLPVRIIRNDTRSRIVFQWPEKVGYDVIRKGDTIVVNFNQVARPKLIRLRVDPPKFVKTADAVKRLGGLEVRVEIEADAGFSHFREGNDVIIDIVPANPDEGEHVSDADVANHQTDVSEVSKVVVEVVDTANGVQVKFPWGRDVAASIFRRGDFLWAIFDATADIDLSGFERGSYFEVADMVDFSTEDLTFVRLALGPRSLVTVKPEHHAWRILLGETAFGDTQNINLIPDLHDPEQARIFAKLPSANLVHRIVDPEVGDEVLVVTAFGPPQGLISSRKYIDFLALPSAHGLAFQPISEDLEVSTHEGMVFVDKVGGLSVTGAGSGAELESVDLSADRVEPEVGEVAANGDVDVPGHEEPSFVRFSIPTGEEHEGYYATLATLNEELGLALKEVRSERRFALAEFYFSYGLLAEAIGVIDTIATEEPGFTNAAAFVVLKGSTQHRMHRNKAALDTLAHFSVKEDTGAALWRGMALEELGFHKKARSQLAKGLRDEERYPPEWRAKFRLAETAAALGVNDVWDANTMWENIPLEVLNDQDRAEAFLTKGKILNAIGEPALALEYFDKVFPLTDGEMAHRARYNITKMLYDVGEIDANEAAERFERLRYQWRGDDLELKALRALGEIYLDQERYRDALTVMRVGFTFNPQHPISRNMRDRVGEVFQELYLDGKADAMASTAAIALFYDFRELTPIGTKGDRMIRLLTERLVSIGLFDQAAELLEHQVKYRLKGTARAQVALRLALIQLKNRRPEEAFKAIAATRFSGLPHKLNGQRRLIEARALSDMGRFNHAVELLEDDVSPEAELLRANIYWDADNWPETGRVYESILESKWGTDEALPNDARASVMRMAIAYALVDDKPALERIRRKFGVQMTASPDAQAFNIATGDLALRGVAFRDVLRRVNSIDTFESFMTDFKNRFGDDGSLLN